MTASLRAQTTGVSRIEDQVAATLLTTAERQVRLPLEGVRRTADFAWPEDRVAVFVDGCYWHGHGCRGRSPSDGFWAGKVRRNQERDADTDTRLRAIGWLPLHLWECDIRAMLRTRHAAHRATLRPPGRGA